MKSDLLDFCQMLGRAEIRYEVDYDTYPDRIIVRTFTYDIKISKNKVSAIFDFSDDGKLMFIG